MNVRQRGAALATLRSGMDASGHITSALKHEAPRRMFCHVCWCDFAFPVLRVAYRVGAAVPYASG
eukprot:4458916-Alexandrium_andersonii.AAC.1